MDMDANQLALEPVPCDFCGSTHSSLLLHGEDWRYGVPGEYSVVRCANCGLVYQNPRPIQTELFRAYPASYTPHKAVDSKVRAVPTSGLKRKVKTAIASQCYGLPSGDGAIERIITSAARRYSHSRGHAWLPPLSEQQNRALDIGCGSGIVLRQLREEGWSAIGIEIDEIAARRARKASNLPVIVGTIPGVELGKEQFDLVILQHVLEHLPSPSATLRKVAELLKPGGYARISVPNFASLERKVLREYWYALELPRHFYHFEPHTLEKYLRRSGLDVAEMQFTSEGWGLLVSLMRLQHGSNEVPGRVARAAGSLLALGLSLLRIGGVMTVYCRKPIRHRPIVD